MTTQLNPLNRYEYHRLRYGITKGEFSMPNTVGDGFVQPLPIYLQTLLAGEYQWARRIHQSQYPLAWPIAFEWTLKETSYSASPPPLNLRRVTAAYPPAALAFLEVATVGCLIFRFACSGGVPRTIVCDLDTTGTMVIPACDWLEVYAIGCLQSDGVGVVLKPPTGTYQWWVRQSELYDDTDARFSWSTVTWAALDGPMIPWVWPTRVRSVTIDVVNDYTASNITDLSWLNAAGRSIRKLTWTRSTASAGGAGVSRGDVPPAGPITVVPPTGTTFLQCASQINGAQKRLSVSAELGGLPR